MQTYRDRTGRTFLVFESPALVVDNHYIDKILSRSATLLGKVLVRVFPVLCTLEYMSRVLPFFRASCTVPHQDSLSQVVQQ